MDFVEFQWLEDGPGLRQALQELLQCSGQLLKRYFSSKQLERSIMARDLTRLPLDFVNHMKINPVFKGPRPSIIKETAQYLVLHKPPGVHGHPLRYSDQDTLLNFLVEEKKWDCLNVNQESYDRGLLYRLDNETSGVVVMAKEQRYYETMRTAFKEKMKSKYYLAVVAGDFDQEGEWTHYFKATGLKGAKQKVLDHQHEDAQAGSLRVKKVATKDNLSLVLVKLETGLRHQIRAQLSHLGFPILGDEFYGGKKAQRVFLHAWRYEWDDVVVDNEAEDFAQYFDLSKVEI